MEIKKYLKYAYYDEGHKLIAVLEKETPQETINEARKIYDEVEFE